MKLDEVIKITREKRKNGSPLDGELYLVHALSSGSHFKSSVPLSHENALVKSAGSHHRRVGHRGGSTSPLFLNVSFQIWEVRRDVLEGQIW